jgi:hypothetical protein
MADIVCLRDVVLYGACRVETIDAIESSALLKWPSSGSKRVIEVGLFPADKGWLGHLRHANRSELLCCWKITHRGLAGLSTALVSQLQAADSSSRVPGAQSTTANGSERLAFLTGLSHFRLAHFSIVLGSPPRNNGPHNLSR